MKVAFDENIPDALISALKAALEGQSGDYEISSARAYANPPAETDVPWLKKFTDAGGEVVVTADKKIRGKPHERKALHDLGLITFFFSPQFNNLMYWDKLAMCIRWWPHIIERIEQSKAGDCWEIPMKTTGNAGDMKNVTYTEGAT